MQFDPHTGALRLDGGAFLALADRAAGHVLGSSDRDHALRDAGVLVDGAPHPTLAAALAAVASPRAQLTVTVASEVGVRVHQGWLAAATGLLVDLGDGTYELRTLATDEVADTVLRLASLEPRPALPAAAVVVREQTLDDLASEALQARRRGAGALASGAPATWSRWATLVAAGRWAFTVVDAFWATRFGSLADRRVALLDTPAGVVLVDAAGDDLRLLPTTAEEARRVVAGVLPSEVEVRGT